MIIILMFSVFQCKYRAKNLLKQQKSKKNLVFIVFFIYYAEIMPILQDFLVILSPN